MNWIGADSNMKKKKCFVRYYIHHFQGTLEGLRQFLITESPLEMMKNAFYFILKAHFVLKFLSYL